jgi:hypothetical protein
LQLYFTQISSDSASSTGNTRGAADTHQRIANLSSEAMSLADAALADAFALRQLIENYPSVKTRVLEASSRWLLEAMIREHLQSVRTGTQRSRTLLEPVLRSLEPVDQEVAHSDDTEEVAPPVDSAGQIQQLFQTIRRMERLTAFLFAGATLPEEQGKHAVAGLLTGFDRVDRQSQGMADYGNRSDGSDSATPTQQR